MSVQLPHDWPAVLEGEFDKPYFMELRAKLAEAYRTEQVYPAQDHIFQALQYTPYKETKVVILGQDPYHGPGQAHGLSFSVQPGVRIPPSLRNIYQELQSDIGCQPPSHGCLTPWAKQGVLLLNAVLTVEAGRPNSHQKLGWELFTDRIIAALGQREHPVVFLLWGKHAQMKASMIDASRHCVIESAHPSPFAARRGFFGSQPFSRANAFLRSIGSEEINWCLPANPEGLNDCR
ncbi:uracil-DNA glycosylase [Paenibacillus tarimensis]|uniref:uracil-DNA glycosylase n=1 Tax=Paenibacillus tarimensis TaxID=416012 RepID=UPI001F36E36D|nr:uracil-DNA glycosylase [Paenibacillus tarimensis]MCF2942151.1 uracil-DNA glycosylase [Paenibacillus tarimensis]